MKLRIPKIIRRDFLRKFVAVFFAVLIWYAVDTQLHSFQTFHDIPVQLRYEPDKVVLERRSITATVTLRGARRRLQEIQSNDISVRAQVPPVPPGVFSYDVHLSPSDVKSPPGTRVADIEPENVRIQVDRIVTREVPVRVRERGELSFGYKVARKNVVPSRIDIVGPSKIVEEIDEVVSEEVIFDETVLHDFEIDEVELMPMPRVRFSPQSVHVSYEVSRHGGQQDFPELPVQLMQVPGGKLKVAAAMPKVTVNLRGSKAILEELQPHQIHPFIDITAVTNPGRYTFKVNVWINGAASLTVSYVQPAEIDLVLENSESSKTGTPSTADASPPSPDTDAATQVPANAENTD
jgi:YbbR domain-containing protein